MLLFLFFSFQMFTPFFYQEEHLIDHGLRKINMYYQLGDHQLSFSERSELVESIFTNTWNNAYLNRLSSEFAELELKNIEVTEFSRRFTEYELIVEVEVHLIDQEPNIERNIGYFTFTREKREFKIAGFHFNNGN
ncbi:hypothetical protein H1D32_12110 [Anaerobacillus sp. CMMVII]|uniref:hypothetical protein n=1 Tax=Anaerobacillus sp. CMMVII TaxID=2755588 RepID=UPI0021B791F2|nr:hypothetical protein [Anaerobacillus sp. CMMVII]MCT8138422.1 hypothetical protein [Anaerobacillus sp. CMMVII]